MSVAALPEVGVVIANFNNASFVATAIESVHAQTARDLSVVIVDDASSDASDGIIGATLARLKDPRLRYVRLDANLGQAGAIRQGLRLLDTSFVCFLDSDDYWYPEFIERHLTAHLNADYPVSLSFCDSHIVDKDGRLLAGTAWWFDSNEVAPAHRVVDPALLPHIDVRAGTLAYPPRGKVVLRTEWSLGSATNTMSGMMFRRSFVDLVLTLPDDQLKLYVDFYLSTLASLLTGCAALYDALYAYRMHGQNLHSNGRLHGGAYNSSTADWQPIQALVLALVQRTLRNEAAPLKQAFGAEKYDDAVRALANALEPPPPPVKRGWRPTLRRLLG